MSTLQENILCKKLSFKQGELNVNESVNFLMDLFKKSKKEEVIIVNIGTDKALADSFAPMLGSVLELNNCKIPFYGTLEEPIHALNMEKRLEEIYRDHPNAFVIGVDACLGARDNVNDIMIRNKPIQAGKGVGKNLPNVGDASIIFIADDVEYSEFFTMRAVRLGHAMKSAREICTVVSFLEKELYSENTYKKVI